MSASTDRSDLPHEGERADAPPPVDLNPDEAVAAGPSSESPPSEPAGDSAPAPSATIGHIGRYALKQRLGEGGLGTVYAAYDPILSRTIAVKTLHLAAVEGDRAALDALFLNEARAAAGLNHPNIVTVYDAGLSEQGVYIAMERLRGRDLRQLLANGWRPDIVQTVQIVRRVADALSYAHSKGVIHCDIKPANIFMVGRTLPKVVDFGIARVAHGQAIPALEGVVAGSPHYLAPEQLNGETVDRRCDVYSLGVVMYELLAHRKAFNGQSLAEIVDAVQRSNPPPVHVARPEVPASLSTIVQQAMAREPASRYRSARHLARELRQWLETEGDLIADDSPAATGFQQPPLTARAVTGATALVAVVAAAWWWMQEPSAPAPVAALPSAVNPAPEPAPVTPAIVEGPSAAREARRLEVAAASAAAALATAPPVQTTAPPAIPRAEAAAAGKRAPPDAAARDRTTRSAAKATPTPPAAPAAVGALQLAITPWGRVEVDGAAVGVTPPLARLSLSVGEHVVTIRNEDFPPYTTTVRITTDQPVVVRHRFGS